MRQIVLDTETTGLEPSQGHRIIEIGCVELVNRKLTGRHYHQYIQPEREVEQQAIEATIPAVVEELAILLGRHAHIQIVRLVLRPTDMDLPICSVLLNDNLGQRKATAGNLRSLLGSWIFAPLLDSIALSTALTLHAQPLSSWLQSFDP